MDYLEHLLDGIEKNRQNSIRQHMRITPGQPDPLDAQRKSDLFYQPILYHIYERPPENWVRSITLLLDEDDNRLRAVGYSYCEKDELYSHLAINIDWDEASFYKECAENKLVIPERHPVVFRWKKSTSQGIEAMSV